MNIIKKIFQKKKHNQSLSKILFLTSQLFLYNINSAFKKNLFLGLHLSSVYITSCLLWWNYNNSGIFRNIDNINVLLLIIHFLFINTKNIDLIKNNIGILFIAIINAINYKLIDNYNLIDDITFVIIHALFHIRSYLFIKKTINRL